MIKIFLPLLITLTAALAQDGEVAVIPSDTTKDPGLKIGDIAPSWALMSGPGKFEFLKTWTEEKGKKLRKPTTQPDRHVVLLSFFATWCKPCMKELPHLQNLYEKYKNDKIKFFLIDITEATRTVKGWEDSPKAGPFLAEKGITMPILFDSRGVAKERYGAKTLPRLFVVDKYRTIQLAKTGFDENEDFEALKKRIGEASGTEWIAVMIDASSDKGIYSIEEIYVIAEQYFFWGQDEFMDERFWKMITKATNVKNKNEFFEKYKRVCSSISSSVGFVGNRFLIKKLVNAGISCSIGSR